MTDSLKQNLLYYSGKNILATLNTGEEIRGIYMGRNAATSAIIIDQTEFEEDDIKDIVAIDKIKAYNTESKTGYLESNCPFKESGLADPSALPLVYYDEYNCTVSCHLELRSQLSGQMIYATDIEILEKSLRYDFQALSAMEYLYFMADGSVLLAKMHNIAGKEVLQNWNLETIDFDPSAVSYITKVPEINDSVSVTLKDGTAYTDLLVLNRAGNNIILACDGNPVFVDCADIVSLRFNSNYSENEPTYCSYGDIRKEIEFKDTYITGGADKLYSGARISYEISITPLKIAARNISFQTRTDVTTVHGVILTFYGSEQNRTNFIGSHYLNSDFNNIKVSERPRGDIYFTIDALPADQKFLDVKHNIYVVKCTCIPSERRKNLREAISVEIIETLDRMDYSSVKVSPDGIITADSTRDMLVDYIIGTNCRLTLKDGRVLRGIARYSEDSQRRIVLRSTVPGSFDEQTVETSDIADIRGTGKISVYRGDGVGFITCGENLFFHISDLRYSYEQRMVNKGAEMYYKIDTTRRGINALDITFPRKGYVINRIDGEEPILVPEDKYLRGEHTGFAISELTDEYRAYLLEHSNEDIRVDYVVDSSNPEKTEAEIISIGTAGQQVYRGYIIKYIESKGLGFICDEEHYNPLEENLNGQYIFYPSYLQNYSDTIDTRNYHYLISFNVKKNLNTIDDGREKHDIATNVNVLSVLPIERQSAATVQRISIAPVPPEKDEPAVISSVCPDTKPGENIVLQMNDDTLTYATYNGRTNTAYLINDNRSVLKNNVKSFLRFGIITHKNTEGGYAILNNLVKFDLSALDTKTFNVLKAAGERCPCLHVVYTCEDGKIATVTKIPPEITALVPWSPATVTNCLEDERFIVANNDIRHHVTVNTDGLISREFNSKTLLNKKVFLRKTSQLYTSSEGDTALISVALDLRRDEEITVLRYDAMRDQFRAYRNDTYSFAVNGNRAIMETLIEQNITCKFHLSADRLSLIATSNELGTPEQSQSGAEANDTTESASLIGSRLVQFLLGKINLASLVSDIDFGEDGLPASKADAQKAFRLLSSRNDENSILAAAKIFLEKELKAKEYYPWYEIIKAMQKHCSSITLDGDLGEYSYFLSVLLDSTSNAGYRQTYLYWLLAQDFLGRLELSSKMNSTKWNVTQKPETLLFTECKNIREFVAHLIMLPDSACAGICEQLDSGGKLHDALCEHFARFDIGTDDDAPASITDWITLLSGYHSRVKRSLGADFARITESNASVCKSVLDAINALDANFFSLVCATDEMRFEKLKKCCEGCLNAERSSDFSIRERQLNDVYNDISALIEDIYAHPTKDIFEVTVSNSDMSYDNNILLAVKREIQHRLNSLYSLVDTQPKLNCYPNENHFLPDQKSITLILENNGINTSALQAAEDLVISFNSDTFGVYIQNSVRKFSRLEAGNKNRIIIEVPIEADDLLDDTISIDWTVSYSYISGFEDGPVRTSETKDTNQPIVLQLESENAITKDINAPNPYERSALGQPLSDGKMFFGRKREMADLWNFLIEEKDGKNSLIRGSTVIMYGQKKCGKTSLVNQLRNKLLADKDLSDSIICIDFNNILAINGGAEALPLFTFCFYRNILNNFRREIKANHPDVVQMLEENGLEIPSFTNDDKMTFAADFQNFFSEFEALDKHRHTILITMDEFTSLCSTIDEFNTRGIGQFIEYWRIAPEQADTITRMFNNIPKFIKLFSEMGFAQLIIGHETMMRLFEKLGVINHGSEFAKCYELSALDEEGATDLITVPMREAFGFDPYDSPLGKEAIQRMLELSGRSPRYLNTLCNEMFNHYITLPSDKIVKSDVDKMAESLVSKMEYADFDILLMEDGDERDVYENLDTFKYLKAVAEASFNTVDNTCEYNLVCTALEDDPADSKRNSEEIRNLLESRRVLTVTNGRIKINAGIFAEFIKRKYGGNY